MYKETDAVTAFMQYKMGGKGYILHDNGEIWPFKDSFKQFDNARFIVDFPDEKPEPEKAVVVPEVETPEDNLEVVTPEKRRRGKPTEEEKHKIEQRILQAWNGDRSIMDVVKETGYDYRTVRKYLPETVNG